MACSSLTAARSVGVLLDPWPMLTLHSLTLRLADRTEFLKICQAVGVGFTVMGAVGYIVKLSMTAPKWKAEESLQLTRADSPYTGKQHISRRRIARDRGATPRLQGMGAGWPLSSKAKPTFLPGWLALCHGSLRLY